MSQPSDHIQRFLLEEANVRGEIVSLHETYKEIISQRPYPRAIQQLLGETLLAASLLTETLKFEGSLSIQFEGNKHLSLLLVQCTHERHLRGIAKYEEGLDDETYFKAFTEGTMVLTLQPEKQTQSYQSKLDTQSASIAQNIMHYFSQSEQLPTYVWLNVDESHAFGLLLQVLPSNTQNQEQRMNFWEYAMKMAETLTPKEAFSLNHETLLYRLYHETPVRLFEPKSLSFQCRCTPEKMRQVLRVIGEEECQKLLSTYHTIEVNCDFCNQAYSFDAIDVAMVFPS